MTRPFISLRDSIPAIIFLALALFLVARLLIGIYPSSEWSWAFYLAIAPMLREVGVFYPAGGVAQTIAPLCAFLALAAGAYMVMRKTGWLRAKFFVAHGAALVLVVGLADERVFNASLDGAVWMTPSYWPNYFALAPMSFTLLAALAWTCLSVHRRIIWRMRHPVRRVV